MPTPPLLRHRPPPPGSPPPRRDPPATRPHGTARGGRRPTPPRRVARVVLESAPDHLDHPFDYLVGEGQDVRPGSRVDVVFAGRRVRGLVVDVAPDTDVPAERLRTVRAVLGSHTWVTPDELEVLAWAADRFAGSVGSVVRHALPVRVVGEEERAAAEGWFPPGAAPRPPDPPPLRPAPSAWSAYGAGGVALRDAAARGGGAWYWRPLPGEDLGARLVELATATLSGGRDVLVVVPEATCAAADAVVAAAGALAVDVRGDVGARGVYRAWLAARTGRARVVVGQRGVGFWPLQRLGLVVVVDEANPALKERRAPRHHAREVALERARRAGAAAVLVGTVPSAAAWRLLAERRLHPVVPARTAERAAAPLVRADDRSHPRSRGRLGTLSLRALRDAVGGGAYGVVLAARAGEGRALVCASCGERHACPRCDCSLAGGVAAFCDGCGWEAGAGLVCRRCGGRRTAPLAAGAARLGAELAASLPGVEVATLEGYAAPAPPPPAILVMTRGSALIDPPGPVGAVVVPDLDGLLRRPALDAAEDAVRLAFRVAGWVARRPDPDAARGGRRGGAAGGVVVVETRDPAHHAVQALVGWDPGGFWRAEVPRRAELGFPPVRHAIRVDAAGDGEAVAASLRAALPPADEVLGPRPDADGRAAILLKSAERTVTLTAIRPLRAGWSRARRDVRVDVDPVDVM